MQLIKLAVKSSRTQIFVKLEFEYDLNLITNKNAIKAHFFFVFLCDITLKMHVPTLLNLLALALGENGENFPHECFQIYFFD